MINLLRFARVQYPDANGGLSVIKSNGKKAVGAVKDDGQFASFARAILFAHALREDPRMASPHNAFHRRRDAEAEAGLGLAVHSRTRATRRMHMSGSKTSRRKSAAPFSEFQKRAPRRSNSAVFHCFESVILTAVLTGV